MYGSLFPRLACAAALAALAAVPAVRAHTAAASASAPATESAPSAAAPVARAASSATRRTVDAPPLVVLARMNTGPSIDRSQCVTVALAPGGAFECGDLRVAHALPAHRTVGRAWAPTLIYNSQHARPRPIVYADVTVPVGSAVPTTVEIKVVMADLTVRKATFSGASFTPGVSRRIGVQWDHATAATGLQPYTVQVTSHYPAGPLHSTPLSGELAIVGRKGTQFGAGWWVAGWEQIICVNCGTGARPRMLWIGGDGSTRIYEPLVDWSTWIAQNPDGAPDTLRHYVAPGVYGGAAYSRKLPGGGEIVFDGWGSHIQTRNRLGRVTHFDVDTVTRRLLGIYAPTPSSTVAPAWLFGYNTGGQLWTVTAATQNAPARVVYLTNPDGRVTAIQDPDGGGVTYTYDTAVPERITGQHDRRGSYTSYTWDAAGKIASSRSWMGGTPNNAVDPLQYFIVAESRGVLFDGSTTGSPAGGSDVYTRIDGPRLDVTDHTYLWLNPAGYIRHVRDAALAQTAITYGDARFPALPTQVASTGKPINRAWYDFRGRPDSTRVVKPLGTGGDVVTRYRWDDRWDTPDTVRTFGVVNGVATELTGASYTAYDSITGNVLWKQQGPDAVRTVTFGYWPAGHPAAGQLANVRTPADVAAGVRGDSLYYDAMGNLAQSVSPGGMRTQVVNDGLGRPWVTVSPVDPAQGLFRRDSVVYDAMGRVEWSISTGPALSNGVFNLATGAPWSTPQERLFVRNTYDPAGLVLAVRRWSVPDTAHVDTMISRFEYDRAGRRTVEISADNLRDSTEYDPAGNAVAAKTRRGYRITMTYDVMNRLSTRTMPGTRPDTTIARSIDFGASFHFPTWGTEASGNATVANGVVTLPGDIERFAYDSAGNMVYAANREAIVRRRYNPNGTLRADTLVIATYATRDTTQHVYGLRYDYDLLGRRTDLHHPGTLAPAGGWTVQNGYDPVTGALTGVTDPTGPYHFGYTAGQLTSETYPNGVTEAYTHDAEGRLRTRTLNLPGMSGPLDNDTMTYDARGKLSFVRQRMGTVQNFYSGLGSLAWSRSTQNNYDYIEHGYVQDALGNAARVEKYDFSNRDIPVVDVTRHTYQPHMGRLVARDGGPGGGADPTAGGSFFYDEAGNNIFSTDSRVYPAIPNSRRVEGKASYYDAADRLRVVDRKACAWTDSVTAMPLLLGFIPSGPGHTVMRCVGLHAGDGSAFEEYRYDALGRRVLVRTRAGMETVTRTVWDGDRLLWEIRAAGAQPEQDVVPAGQVPPYNISTGRVAYTFGAALDHPLAVHRFEYRDSVFERYDTVPAPLSFQPLTIYPHTNWRGDYQIGTYVTGETQRCARVPSQPEDHETVDGSQPGGSSGIQIFHTHCLAPVPWAGKYIWLDHSLRAAPPGNPDLWVGSLVHNKRDLTGNIYMRNRYYDPATGRFTQEDPIGLAGGLNAYGFAAGDPVSYSDPYGLCPYAAPWSRNLSDCPAGTPHITSAFALMMRTRQGSAVADDYIRTRTEARSGSCGRGVAACYSPGNAFVTVSGSGSTLFRAGQLIHEFVHKRMWEAGWDGAGSRDMETHEIFAWYLEFEFYTNFDAAARRDQDLKADYGWYRRNADAFLSHVCTVRYEYTNC